MGKSQRAKGARGERELAKLWQEAVPHVAVRRTGQDQAHQAESKPGDIDVGGLPYSVEAKRRKRLSWTTIREGLAQAVDAASEGEMPVLCAREDRGEWIVALRLEDWLEVVAERHAGWARPMVIKAQQEARRGPQNQRTVPDPTTGMGHAEKRAHSANGGPDGGPEDES